MRHFIPLFVAVAVSVQPAALLAQDAIDTRVYLTDGTVVQGQLLERSADLVIVRARGGEVFTFAPEQIRHIVTLDSLGSQAQTVTVTEFPYISFLGGAVAFSLLSWLQFDTATDRDAEARVNDANELTARAKVLRDKADRARLLGWSSAALATGSLGVALIPRKQTRKVFPELTLDSAGAPRLGLAYVQRF